MVRERERERERFIHLVMGQVQINGQTGQEHMHMTKFTGIYRLYTVISSEIFTIFGDCCLSASELSVWQT